MAGLGSAGQFSVSESPPISSMVGCLNVTHCVSCSWAADSFSLSQKEQLSTKGRPFRGMSEEEVFTEVANLFRGQEDLLSEFGQFLPEAKRSLVSTEHPPWLGGCLLSQDPLPRCGPHGHARLACPLGWAGSPQEPHVVQAPVHVKLEQILKRECLCRQCLGGEDWFGRWNESSVGDLPVTRALWVGAGEAQAHHLTPSGGTRWEWAEAWHAWQQGGGQRAREGPGAGNWGHSLHH